MMNIDNHIRTYEEREEKGWSSHSSNAQQVEAQVI
jgi:hypothetical protein